MGVEGDSVPHRHSGTWADGGFTILGYYQHLASGVATAGEEKMRKIHTHCKLSQTESNIQYF